MLKRIITIFVPVCLVIGFVTCFSSCGNEKKVVSNSVPGRIISLAPSLTKSLYLLGAGEKLKGCTTYCIEPEDAKKKPKIGSLVKFDLERIVALKPDLVLGMEFSDRKAVERLRSLGIRVELFPSAKNFDHLCQSFLRLGKMVDREDHAKKIIADSKKQVAAIREKTKNQPILKIFWQLGARPLFAATKNYFSHDYIIMSNGVNIVGDVKNGLYSREKVISGNPDVIVMITMGIPTQSEVETWKKFTTINAVKNNRIFVVNADKYCSPTPAGFVAALKEMIGYLHPDLSLSNE